MSSRETTAWPPSRWPQSEWVELAGKLRHAANLMSLPALPDAWPDWLTPTKRASMSVTFIRAATEVEARHVHE